MRIPAREAPDANTYANDSARRSADAVAYANYSS